MKNPIILSIVTLLLSIGFLSCNEDDDFGGNPNDSNTSQPIELIGEAVDLGLPSGNLWSSCNIGAKSVKEYGYYYAWGETDTKQEYSLVSYIHYDNQWQNYINIGNNISESSYDIVSIIWGNGWHMPNEADFLELIEHCNWEWIKYENSVWGYKIEGKNGNKIFLPATGYYQDSELIGIENQGCYWSSSLSNYKSSEAISLCINSTDFRINSISRFCGLAIRPVKSVPEWKSLGFGTFRDRFFFKNKYEVEIQQSNRNSNKFRLIQPYLTGFFNPAEGYTSDEFSTQQMDSSFIFRILHSGENFRDVNISKDGLVVWDIYNTGFFNSTYSDWINIISPISFSSFDNEEDIENSNVTSWQDNGLPAQIHLAPWYYMKKVGGWDYSYIPYPSQNIIITFPGVTIPDYFMDFEHLGQHAENNIVYADFDVAMGDDITYVKVGMAKTDDGHSVYSGIIDGSINSIEITKSGNVSIALSGFGTYTAYAIPYDSKGVLHDAVSMGYIFEYSVE